jgi:hypothetical protein
MSRAIIVATIDDALHFTDEQRAEIIDSYPEYEREARVRGVPSLGSGKVFLIDEQKLLCDPFDCPSHWIRVGGMDFGWTHYAAFCELWWDRDSDCIYLVRTLRMKESTPLQHVEEIRNWRLRWAWPFDGKAATLAGAGVPLMAQYRDAGLDMTIEAACFEDGGRSVEAGVLEMADRMRGSPNSRWKVFRGQNDAWMQEVATYHRVNGLLIKEHDDAISASRYGMMMRRHGQSAAGKASFNREIRYPNLGII